MAGPVDSYAVMGNPIDHSKSPRIHTLFAQGAEQRMRYSSILVEVGGFTKAVKGFFNNGDLGLSITTPFKEEAWQMAEVKTNRAEKAGAVNTLWRDSEGRLNGDNTDGLGLVTDLKQNHHITLKGKRILILGAGGAVRGVLESVMAEQPSELVIANRTISKAEKLVKLFPDKTVSACGFEDIEGNFDLIINGTAASLQGEMPPVPDSTVTSNTDCYDMMYGAEPTAFNRWAESLGAAQTIDGLGMLVEQAAEQFLIWRNVRPETVNILTMLRKELE
ncbi:shikimate dehydrogenase [Endozoicomonas sp. (ex Bugula neritina AB1)]|nr:shikimate dehydrogenase [Endozoicomonas sp. (ex Bugula neritina AB1)]